MRCEVKGCTYANTNKKSKTDLRFFRFPKDKEVRGKWLLACGLPTDTSRMLSAVCSEHFEQSAYTLRARLGFTKRGGIRMLLSDAVPTRNLPILQKSDSDLRDGEVKDNLLESNIFEDSSNDTFAIAERVKENMFFKEKIYANTSVTNDDAEKNGCSHSCSTCCNGSSSWRQRLLELETKFNQCDQMRMSLQDENDRLVRAVAGLEEKISKVHVPRKTICCCGDIDCCTLYKSR